MKTKTIKIFSLCLIIFAAGLFTTPKVDAANTTKEALVAQVSYSQPKVVATSTSDLEELPRTGVPLIAWSLAALAPLGFLARKSRTKTSKDLSPHTLWLKRQLTK